MAPQVEMLTVKSHDLSLIPETHKVEEENRFLLVFWPTRGSHETLATPNSTYKKKKKWSKF